MRLEGGGLACFRGGREVFAGLDFAVESGEALLVTGRNGVGKSTLLRVIAGLVRLTGGQLTLTGGDSGRTIGESVRLIYGRAHGALSGADSESTIGEQAH